MEHVHPLTETDRNADDLGIRGAPASRHSRFARGTRTLLIEQIVVVSKIQTGPWTFFNATERNRLRDDRSPEVSSAATTTDKKFSAFAVLQ